MIKMVVEITDVVYSRHDGCTIPTQIVAHASSHRSLIRLALNRRCRQVEQLCETNILSTW